MNVMEDVELYYIQDLRSKRWSGVRFTGKATEHVKLSAFFDRMQIVMLNLVLRRRGKK